MRKIVVTSCVAFTRLVASCCVRVSVADGTVSEFPVVGVHSLKLRACLAWQR